MNLNKAIKFNAKRCLKQKWGKAILIFLIVAAVSIVLGALDNAIFSALGFRRVQLDADLFRGGYMKWIAEGSGVTWYEVALSVLLSLVRLCIMAPLALGITNWALELSDGRSNSVATLFWAFDNAAWYRSVWLEITVAVKKGLFTAAVGIVPVIMMTIGQMNLIQNRATGVLLLIIGAVLGVAAVPFIWWFSARYFAAELLLCDRYYYTVKEATRLSVTLTKGRRWKIVGFYLSFFPWYLLCLLVIPVLYVIPYLTVASTMMARYLFEDYLLGQNRLDISDPDRLIIDDVAPEDYNRARAEQGMTEWTPEPAAQPTEPTEQTESVSTEEDNGGIAEL